MINVIRTTVSIYRNVKDFKFVPKLTDENKTKIADIVKSALPNFTETKLKDISASNQAKLYGLNNSNYSTVFIDKNADVGISLFDGEHLKITASNYGYNKDVFKDAVAVSETLKNKVNLAYSDEYGYLMSDLSLIGNGLKCECDFVLTGINSLNKISQVKQNVLKLGYKLTETDEDDVYTLSTRCNLGKTMQEVWKDFEQMVQNLQELETESVKLLESEDSDEMYDKYIRSLAILQNAHIMPFDELKQLVAQLRMGLNLGYKEVALNKVNELQQLILNKNSQFVSKSELIDLASKVKKVLKGE